MDVDNKIIFYNLSFCNNIMHQDLTKHNKYVVLNEKEKVIFICIYDKIEWVDMWWTFRFRDKYEIKVAKIDEIKYNNLNQIIDCDIDYDTLLYLKNKKLGKEIVKKYHEINIKKKTEYLKPIPTKYLEKKFKGMISITEDK